jgi:2-oxoisovalerate dehydrogenase E2 component (dihydrolipoyl transacylase)
MRWIWASNLRLVRGSGPAGRMLHEDLDAYWQGSRTLRQRRRRLRQRNDEEQMPVIGLRRKIAQRMQDAKRAAHFSYVEEIDVTALEALRAATQRKHGAAVAS